MLLTADGDATDSRAVDRLERQPRGCLDALDPLRRILFGAAGVRGIACQRLEGVCAACNDCVAGVRIDHDCFCGCR